MHNTASKLYDEMLQIYYDTYYYLSHAKRQKVNCKYNSKNLFIKGYDDIMWSRHQEELTDEKESTDKEESTNEKILEIYLTCHH